MKKIIVLAALSAAFYAARADVISYQPISKSSNCIAHLPDNATELQKLWACDASKDTHKKDGSVLDKPQKDTHKIDRTQVDTGIQIEDANPQATGYPKRAK